LHIVKNDVSDSNRSMLLSFDRSVTLRETGLVLPRLLRFQAWQLIGEQLLAVADSSTWWIADWLAYGETAFHDRYREAIQRTSLNYQTLRNYAWVARRLDLSRRRDTLSFGHHAEVAALDQPEQDFWLRKAEQFGWSRNQLRLEVRASQRERKAAEAVPALGSAAGEAGGAAGQAPPASTRASATESLFLKVTGNQLARFTATASKQNLMLDEWALQVLDGAS